MVVSSVLVKISSVNGYGVTTLNDPGTDKQYVRSATVTDGVNLQPSGTVTLPLRNPSTQKPHKDLIKPGDLCTIEFMVNTDFGKKGWWTALHGPVRSVSERTMISDAGSESVCVLNVGSMLDILAADAVAVWMFFYGLQGVDAVRSRLTADESNTRPFEVAFNWLTKVAFDSSTYNPAGSLASYLHLDFGGLEANVLGEYKLTMVEGSHLQIISQFLDSPFHELYASVGTSAEFQGSKTQAGAGGGVKEGGAGTILRWRAAPYPYCDLGGGPNRSEWDKLPLHQVKGKVQAARERGSEYTLAPERNAFFVSPGYDYHNEFFSYTRAVPVVNLNSIRRLGYRPLKTQTSLLLNSEVTESNLKLFNEELSWRLAGQWNNYSQYENGTISLPLFPWIKSGDRLQALSPWQSDRIYEYHVLSRSMSWDAATGGNMTVNLERGVDIEASPNAFAEGLSRIELGGEVVTETFREHDKPGV